ncbi:hypothetical protein [Streptomyces sp. NPDC001194]|uniref:hypothetical protein n=1 Tax=Streptomyces sp. NPDC001194 TaxID=3364547 RepID=UPI0036A5166E
MRAVRRRASRWAGTGEARAVLSGHTDEVTSVASSPDGSSLATGSVDAVARLWDLTSGSARAPLSGQSDLVLSVHDAVRDLADAAQTRLESDSLPSCPRA